MFNLSFLNSSALILSISTIIPLLIYLFAKKRPPRVVFSSLRFIQLSQQKQKKKVNITNLLLLIIRMLIILLTVLAIARPAIKINSLRSKELHPPTAVAIIIDNSYSMDYVVDTQTELDKALEIAGKIRKLLSDEDISIVYTLDKNWNNLNSALNYGTFKEELIRNIEITSQPVKISDVIEKAQKSLQESHLPNREIFYITDMQKQELPEDPQYNVFLIPSSGVTERNNLSVEEAGLAKNFIERGINRQIEFEIVNYNNNPAEDVICSLILDGKTEAEKVIALSPGERQRNRFRIPVEKAGWHSGTVKVRDERLLFDNQYYFSFFYEQNPVTAVITSENKLSPALSTVLEIYTGNKENIHLINTPLTMDKISDYHNVIIWSCHNWNIGDSFIIKQLEEKGHRFLFLTDPQMNNVYYRFLEETFGMSFREYLDENTSKKITTINSYHPVVSRLDSNRPSELRGIWQTNNAPGAVVSAEGLPVVIETKENILWLFDITSFRSPFLVDANFPILAYNCLSYTASAGADIGHYRVGDLYRPKGNTVIKPNGSELATGGRKILLSEPGIYEEKEKRLPVAVNLDYKESRYERAVPEENKKLIFCSSEGWREEIFSARYGFEIWKYLLIVVLVLFLLEVWLIKREEHNAV